jgi:hypothetical protein
MIVKRSWLLLGISFAIVGAFFVLREHWAHALGLAPYLLLLACPLLHLFHGHASHTKRHHGESTPKDEL